MLSCWWNTDTVYKELRHCIIMIDYVVLQLPTNKIFKTLVLNCWYYNISTQTTYRSHQLRKYGFSPLDSILCHHIEHVQGFVLHRLQCLFHRLLNSYPQCNLQEYNQPHSLFQCNGKLHFHKCYKNTSRTLIKTCSI